MVHYVFVIPCCTCNLRKRPAIGFSCNIETFQFRDKIMGFLQVSNKITAELEAGVSREEIFSRLSQKKPEETTKYAYCIASIPTKTLRKKYLTLNALLAVLFVAYAVLIVLAELPIDLNQPTIFILIKSLLPLVFAYFTFHFHGGAYRLMGIWCIYDLLENLLLTGVPTPIAAIKLLVLFTVIVLSFYIARKVFPHLGILGPKKDPSGNYIL